MDIREQIVLIELIKKEDLYNFQDGHTHLKFSGADKILSLPDIKEALELLELKRQGKLVKLADDQSLPYLTDHIKCMCGGAGFRVALKKIKTKCFKRVEKL
jgi:hypothetical protein